MKSSGPISAAGLTLPERIDRVCDRFEQAWELDPRQLIEEVLLGFVPEEREQVLREVLAVELELRRKAAEVPAIGEYLRRFPEYVSIVENAFGASAGDGTLPSVSREESTCPSTPAVSRLGPDASRTSLGNYEILRKLGQGGMGTVYQALHRRLKRVVALKVMRASVTRDEATVRRFEREVEAIARLSHPNVVIAYDADVAEGEHFLVMEFVEGENLTEAVRRNGPFSTVRAVDCIIQAARGLNAVHSLGIIHRDIKPSNLLISRDGLVKVVDLGLARLYEAAEDRPDLTETGAILGTIDYMAPEQAASTKSADRRSDIYSLGCTLYFLLTGRIPFPGGSHVERLLAHREAARPQMSDILPVPAGLQAIFEKMTGRSPADRYESLEDVIRDLSPFSGQSETGCVLSGSRSSPPGPLAVTQSDASARSLQPQRALNRSVPAVVMACAVLTLVGLAGGGWALFGPSRTNARAPADSKVVLGTAELSVPEKERDREPLPLVAHAQPVVSGRFHDRWLQTFGCEPEEIKWPGRNGRGSWDLNEDLRALTISSPSPRLVRIGKLQGDENVDIEFDVESQGWLGERGIILGYRELETDGRDDARFQAISLNSATTPDGRKVMQVHRMRALIDSRIGYVSNRYAVTVELELDGIPAQAVPLSLKLRGGRLVEVRFAGESCAKLVTDEINNRFAPEDYIGAWGVYNQVSVAWFSNPRFDKGK